LQEEAALNKRLLEEAEQQKRLHEESEQLQRSSEEAEPQLSVQEANMQQLNDSVDSQSNKIVDNNNRQQPEQYQQHHHHTESAFNHPSTASHTTPTPDAESPYAAVQEETTEASQTDNHREGVGYVEPVALPATASPVSEVPIKEDAAGFGLFATIVDTVNNFIGKDPQSDPADSSDELHRILYPGRPEVPPSQRKAEGDAYSFTKSLLPYDSSEIRENIRSGFVTYYTFFFTYSRLCSCRCGWILCPVSSQR